MRSFINEALRRGASVLSLYHTEVSTFEPRASLSLSLFACSSPKAPVSCVPDPRNDEAHVVELGVDDSGVDSQTLVQSRAAQERERVCACVRTRVCQRAKGNTSAPESCGDSPGKDSEILESPGGAARAQITLMFSGLAPLSTIMFKA